MNFFNRSLFFRNFLVFPLTLGLTLVSVVSYSNPNPSYAMTKQAQPDRQANNQANNQSIALVLIDQLVQGKFAEAIDSFSPEMRQSVTVEQLQQVWVALTQQLGEFQQIKDVTQETIAGRDVFIIVCQFAKDNLRLRIVVGQDRRIAGFQILPNQIAQAFTPPSYADLSKFVEQEVSIDTGANSLPGTLTIPKGEGKFPVVVLVHGSGPNDRDATLGANKPFRDLAWGLASLGVAVLRYDKRTLIYPQEFQGNFTIAEEVVDDAIAAVEFLRQYTLTDNQLASSINPQKIYVLGHSLGGMVIPRIGARDNQIAGLIALAAPSRPFEDLFLEQINYIANLDGVASAPELQQINAIRQQVEIIRNADWDNLPANTILLGTPISYWRDLREYSPAIASQGLSQRLLILQGERDYQVTMEDFRGWQTAMVDRPNATLKSYPQLNHLLIPGTGTPSPAEYQVPSHVAEIVIKDIASWINNPAP